MKFLIVSSEMPLYDRTSAGLRLFTLIELLHDAGHTVDYYACMSKEERDKAGEKEFLFYKDILQKMDIPTYTGAPENVLRKKTYDAIIFEFYFTAYPILDLVRLWQTRARIIIDSVDLTYLRWYAKAELTGDAADRQFARDVEKKELETYYRSELVLTLTESESKELNRRIPGKQTFNIPNIHPIPALQRSESAIPELLFIGSFTHEPNIDAVKYFYSEIWPLVKQQRPDVQWIIVGPKAPEDIQAMQGDGIDVLGWVPETAPYLNRSWISLAPLRFGAGMKGKVGEAMAFGSPIVSTSFGAQGLGASDGCDLLVADDAESFSNAIIRLLDSTELRQEIGGNGRKLIKSKYSKDAIAQRIPQLTHLIASLPIHEQPSFAWASRLSQRFRNIYQEHIGWRRKGE